MFPYDIPYRHANGSTFNSLKMTGHKCEKDPKQCAQYWVIVRSQSSHQSMCGGGLIPFMLELVDVFSFRFSSTRICGKTKTIFADASRKHIFLFVFVLELSNEI